MASPNPFAPPAHPVYPPRGSAEIRLFGPRAIAIHAVLLTPLAGSILAAVNHRRLGNSASLRHTVLVYVGPSAILLVLMALSGETGARILRLVSLAWSLAIARTLYAEHKVLFRRHVDAGGRPARWYIATLCCVGALVLYGVIAEVLELGSGQ